MIVHQANDSLTIQAPAKVNLHLEILGKRPDGFHELETLMVSVSLYDTLVFQREPSGTTVWCSDPNLGGGDDNLVSRAVKLVREETGRADGIRIELVKRIPMAAGLAGGSTDAAATLEGLNRLWGLNRSPQQLAEWSARLGSDIPFFFATPAAVATGRGEKLRACTVGASLDLVIVCPTERLATAAVYQHVTVPQEPVPIGPIEHALETGNVSELAGRLFNRLEEASLQLSHAVAELKRQAAAWDCLGHLMSGSGSAYFAICASPDHAQRLGQSLQSQDLGSVFVVRSSP